jgi:hypothetical protein
VADYRDFWSNPYVSIKKNFAKKIEISANYWDPQSTSALEFYRSVKYRVFSQI